MKNRVYRIVFGTDTFLGKLFDVILLWAILFSVLIVMLESVPSIGDSFPLFFSEIEWYFTILFTIEYGIRIYISPKPLKYIFSVWGIIDFLSIIPTYLVLLLPGTQSLIIIRILRLFRIFRILKLNKYVQEVQALLIVLRNSFRKILVFLFFVCLVVMVMGAIMYVLEGDQHGFKSIPESIYWAVVTVTTVGYGDVIPQTVLGKFIATLAMLIGYAIIAVPTGIITAEMTRKDREK